MYNGNLAEWQGFGGLARMDGLGRLGIPLLGLGIQDFGGDGPEKHCGLWNCLDGPVKHCCLWDCENGPVKHCCLWESSCCWTRGRFKRIGYTCSHVLQYIFPWASMM